VVARAPVCLKEDCRLLRAPARANDMFAKINGYGFVSGEVVN